MIKGFYENLDEMIPNPVCELDYEKDYELLIAVVLSAQTTDKRVNIVTKKLFLYSIEQLALLEVKTIKNIIESLGTSSKKAVYVKEIAKRILLDKSGKVPNDREYLQTLPGVGRKTASVVLANLFDEPSLAVDTHMIRTTNVLGLVKNEYNPVVIEKILMKKIPKQKWNRVNSQLVLFGRYICKAKKPDCDKCLFKNSCKNTK